MYRPSYTCMRGRLVHRTSSMGRSHSGAHAPCNVTQGLGYIYSGKAHNRQLLLGSLQTLDVVHQVPLGYTIEHRRQDIQLGYFSWIPIWDIPSWILRWEFNQVRYFLTCSCLILIYNLLLVSRATLTIISLTCTLT